MPGTIAIFKPFPTFHQLVGLYQHVVHTELLDKELTPFVAQGSS